MILKKLLNELESESISIIRDSLTSLYLMVSHSKA